MPRFKVKVETAVVRHGEGTIYADDEAAARAAVGEISHDDSRLAWDVQGSVTRIVEVEALDD
jgi:hypothetical protein